MSLHDTGKRKLHAWTITETCKILREIDKGDTCAAISCELEIPKPPKNIFWMVWRKI